MAAPTVAQVDERIASAEREYRRLIAELRADRREAQARERQEDREFQKLVRDWVGEVVLSSCPCGWRSVDPDELERALAQVVAGLEPGAEAPLREAQARWRGWRKRGKGESRAPQGDALGDVSESASKRAEQRVAPDGASSDVGGGNTISP